MFWGVSMDHTTVMQTVKWKSNLPRAIIVLRRRDTKGLVFEICFPA